MMKNKVIPKHVFMFGLFLGLTSIGCTKDRPSNLSSPISKQLIGQWRLVDFESNYILWRNGERFLISDTMIGTTQEIEFTENPNNCSVKGYMKFDSKMYKIVDTSNTLVHHEEFVSDESFLSHSEWKVENGLLVTKKTTDNNNDELTSCIIKIKDNSLILTLEESQFGSEYEGKTIYSFERMIH